MELAQVRIILVEPAGPLNVGAVARVMKNMGLSQLVLVNPQCEPLDIEAQHMAVHGVDILETAQLVATIPAALTGCQ
ncbi:MAG: RNA methyltransferase, partial [Symploca sp. SIO2E6]|nr:RNA methyltransferase [Symploca sp. SIO2E6]